MIKLESVVAQSLEISIYLPFLSPPTGNKRETTLLRKHNLHVMNVSKVEDKHSL